MLTSFSSLSWLGVATAFAIYFVLGGLWFTVFFNRAYAYSLGKDAASLQNPDPIFIIGPAACSLLITVTTALLMQALGVTTIAAAIRFALVIGTGYLVANTVNIAINPNIPRPLLYGAISGAFHLTGILLVSLILVAMG
ncbi:uncharacterized protein DUF1761 [Neolewinella xylanilytica]|uniref:Uncharacterized protein DUF1761 n=1 Tax=Neolewinella xylanilytica TaxID=1514080 RepID=A0A2S6I706_9BACT|nr:DUF1761 domain-containing protein [Neolewinella xylanilytica]PPK87239.1 uncharacterized protein DUF1761 [Neolewinella xylanilytica]